MPWTFFAASYSKIALGLSRNYQKSEHGFFFSFLFIFTFFFQTPFEAVPYALLKTTVMMTGEFEYEGLITDTQFPELTYVFFLVFMIIMTIIVVNLLIGEYII